MHQIKLSPYAKTFYNEWLLDPTSSRYNITSADQTLFGSLDIERLRRALKRYVAGYVLLNSHIQVLDGEPYWVENEAIHELEYSDEPVNQAELLNYISRSFDLCCGPLYRFKLMRISDGVYRFIVIFHHLVMDGISLNTGLFEEISNFYNNESYTAKDDIDTQIKLITSLEATLFANCEQNKKDYKEFWRQQLSNIESLDLRFLKVEKDNNEPIVAETCNSVREISFGFGETEIIKLAEIKRKYLVTSYVYSQCIFALLLNKYTGQEHFAITYPIAIKEGIDFIYGGQVNLNLIPYQFSQTTTIVDLFNQSREFFRLTTRDKIKYGYYPIADILQENNNKQLLNVYFAQAYFRNKPFEFQGIKKIEASSELSLDGVTQDTLLFEQEPISDKLNYRVKYDKRTISEDLLNNFIILYKKLFLEVLEDIINGSYGKPLSSYSLLNQKQYQQIIYEYNQTKKTYLQDKTIHQLFEEQSIKTPENIAVSFQDTKLTYKALNEQANQLANYLKRQYDVQPEDLIVLCLDRSEHMLIAILAVLKTAAAYVPIDPNYPDDRINHILEDTKTKIIITNKKYRDKLQKRNENVIALDVRQLQIDLSKESAINPQVKMSGCNLAYVIYTSGTTGKPKGVLQQHNNVIRLFAATQEWFHSTGSDVWALFHSYTFDFTVWEIWGALLHGGKLIIPTIEQVRDPYLFYELCYREGVTILNQTPTAFYPFMEVAIRQFNDKPLVKLRYVVFGGEALNLGGLHAWFGLYGYDKPKPINLYGATESTIFITYKEIGEKDSVKNFCIGIPLSDIKLYILDHHQMPLPVGAIGELYVGGCGLARGYLNQPNLTKEKFIFNPFQTEEEKLQNENNRLYKTGDWVRMLPSGNLEYLGRNDSQVKIRGHRIEFGEIVDKLTGYPGVKQAVVVAKEYNDAENNYTDNKYLVAYYVGSQEIEAAQLQDYLLTQLPEYMQPSVLMCLDKIPLTINGKINTKLLPEPNIKQTVKYETPSNEKESFICEAFARILRLKKIGINDDFFKLGGNSIQAIRLNLILKTNFDIKVADIFDLKTPKKLAAKSQFGNDILKKKMEQVKLFYKNKPRSLVLNNSLQKKLECYLSGVENLQTESYLVKPIKNVLLTGATGYLGCNILNQLLKLTDYNIFLLIRADTQKEAASRVNEKFQFYFDESLDSFHNVRLFVVKADIEKHDFGLSLQEYQKLTAKIDSVIHAAALVKHYGDNGQFYSANVQATINLLEFSKLTQLKDFHYISTYSIFQFELASDQEEVIYTEDDLPDNSVKWHNIYSQTKFLGEQQTVKYRAYGIKSNIYRVGNLAFMSENYRVQQNIEDNAFFNWLKCLLELKCITEDVASVQISQTDLTALAIVKLFDKKQLDNDIYHVFNPYLFDLSNIVADNKMPIFKKTTMEQFVDTIIGYLDAGICSDLIIKFLLHQGWLDDLGTKTTVAEILQNKTQHILSQLDFAWEPITNAKFDSYLECLCCKR